MPNPPRSPTTLTTSRNRALDLGTDRAGFGDQTPYDHAAGVPVGWPGGAGTYREVPNPGTNPDPLPAQPRPIK